MISIFFLSRYGFHKVNKSPRGHRTLAENQIWEFSHPKFLRNRPDLLDEIKRKSMEADTARRENGDLQSHVAMLQASQSEMIQQIQNLYENFTEVIKELEDTKQKQENQMQFIKSMMNYISQQNGGNVCLYIQSWTCHRLLTHAFSLSFTGQLPNEFVHIDAQFDVKQEKPPSIFITSHEPNNNNNNNTNGNNNLLDDMFGRPAPLTVQTQNMHCNNNNNGNHRSLGPYGNQLPPSPSPSMLVSDDELDNSMYSPNSPHTPRHQHTNSYSSTSSASFMNTPLDPLSHR